MEPKVPDLAPRIYFKNLNVPDDFDKNDQGFFGFYASENIIIEGACLQQLIDLEYDMKSWLEGTPLVQNCKYVDDKDMFSKMLLQ